MKNYWKKFVKDSEAVSPVIGVILMVAITVILAAIIAAFVLGLGAGPGVTPQARISLVKADADTVCLKSEGGSQGGDNITVANTRVTIAGAIDTTPGWTAAADCATAATYFRTGETLCLSGLTVTSAADLTIADTKTGGVIASMKAPSDLSTSVTVCT